MVSMISSWSRQIIIAVIIATILEMLLSAKSKNAKYIKTIIGIYVMYTVILPIISLANGKNLDFSNIDYENYFENSTIYRELETEISEYENDSFNQTYELNIKQDMENKLSQKGYNVRNINLDLELDSELEEFGKIKKVEIYLSKQNGENGIHINKVQINGNENVLGNIDEKEMENIKIFISQEYGVETQYISIN